MADQLNKYRLLGGSGLRVSLLSLSATTFGITQGWSASRVSADVS